MPRFSTFRRQNYFSDVLLSIQLTKIQPILNVSRIFRLNFYQVEISLRGMRIV